MIPRMDHICLDYCRKGRYYMIPRMDHICLDYCRKGRYYDTKNGSYMLGLLSLNSAISISDILQ